MSLLRIKTLNITYLDEIHALLNNHYIENPSSIYRMVYPKDYLYWYLKYVPDNFIIGLVNKNKLIGLITATLVNMSETTKAMHINLLCIHTALRSHGLATILINEMKRRIGKMDIYYFSSQHINNNLLKSYAIPINYKNLYAVDFIDEYNSMVKPVNINNPFHLLKESEINIVKDKLNLFMDKFKIRNYFTETSAKHFLLPKKDIVYSFVNKIDNEITDFINVYKNYYYCIKKQKIISIATIGYYFYESLTLTEMVTFIIDKLNDYEIDQLNFYNNSDNMTIDITKYLTDFTLSFSMNDITRNEMCIFPF